MSDVKKSCSTWEDVFGATGAREISRLGRGETTELRSKNTGKLVRVKCILPSRAYELKRV